MTSWQRRGSYEFEYDEKGYTGWCRCYIPVPIDARTLPKTEWQEWNNETGETRNRERIN